MTKTLLTTNLPIPVGSSVEYRITVTNSGDIALDPVTVSDTYDVTYLTYTNATATPDTIAAGSLSWTNLGVLAVGGVTNIDVTFIAAASTLPGETTNTVVGTSSTTNGIPLPPVTNDVPVTLSGPDFDVTKTLLSTNQPIPVGSSVVYRITVTNSGDIALDPVTVSDTYDVTYLTYTNATATPDTIGAGALSWTNLGVLAVGGVTNIDVTFLAAASTLPGETTNTVVGTSSTTNGIPLPPVTNDVPVTISGPDFDVTKTLLSTNQPIPVGSSVVYRITVTNSGDIALDPVTVSDTYDVTYLTYTNATATPDTIAAGSLSWTNLGVLAVGGVTNIDVTFIAAASTLPGETTNTVVGTSSTTNGIPLPPVTNDVPVTISGPGFDVTKILLSTNQPIPVGSSVVYLITVTNSGDIALDPVTVSDTYDVTYLTYTNATATPDTIGAGALSWTNLGILAVGGVTNIDVTFIAAASTLPGETTNTVVGTGSTTNGIPLPPVTNDVPVTLSGPDFDVTKTLLSTNQPIPVGSSVVYRITVASRCHR